MSESKSSFFQKINKTDKPLIRLIKKESKSTKINKIRNKSVKITTGNKEIERIVRKC